MEILHAIEKLGYPIAVSAWLMWFVSAHGVRTQKLIEWAVAVKHQIDDIQQTLHLLARQLQTPLSHAVGEGQGVRANNTEGLGVRANHANLLAHEQEDESP